MFWKLNWIKSVGSFLGSAAAPSGDALVEPSGELVDAAAVAGELVSVKGRDGALVALEGDAVELAPGEAVAALVPALFSALWAWMKDAAHQRRTAAREREVIHAVNFDFNCRRVNDCIIVSPFIWMKESGWLRHCCPPRSGRTPFSAAHWWMGN